MVIYFSVAFFADALVVCVQLVESCFVTKATIYSAVLFICAYTIGIGNTKVTYIIQWLFAFALLFKVCGVRVVTLLAMLRVKAVGAMIDKTTTSCT